MSYLFTHEGKVFSPDSAVKVDPKDVDKLNEKMSEREIVDFKAMKHGKSVYFAYWRDARALVGKGEITTWMGDKLADIVWAGKDYIMPAYGVRPSIRRNFRAKGIDGRMYGGTYYVSSGNYVRMRAIKGDKR